MGDLQAGIYYLQANITAGNASEIRFWDNVGNDIQPHVSLIPTDAGNHISLSFRGPAIGAGLMVATPDVDMNIVWRLNGVINSPGAEGTATPTPSGTPEPPSASMGFGPGQLSSAPGFRLSGDTLKELMSLMSAALLLW
jgi:hypothetical protein